MIDFLMGIVLAELAVVIGLFIILLASQMFP